MAEDAPGLKMNTLGRGHYLESCGGGEGRRQVRKAESSDPSLLPFHATGVSRSWVSPSSVTAVLLAANLIHEFVWLTFHITTFFIDWISVFSYCGYLCLLFFFIFVIGVLCCLDLLFDMHLFILFYYYYYFFFFSFYWLVILRSFFLLFSFLTRDIPNINSPGLLMCICLCVLVSP